MNNPQTILVVISIATALVGILNPKYPLVAVGVLLLGIAMLIR